LLRGNKCPVKPAWLEAEKLRVECPLCRQDGFLGVSDERREKEGSGIGKQNDSVTSETISPTFYNDPWERVTKGLMRRSRKK
jgi:hypothetical protein